MLVPVLVAAALLVWSVAANLVVGEHLYVARNLIACTLLLVVARATGSGWRDLGLDRATVRAGLRWGAAAAIVVVLVVALGVLLRDVVPFVDALLADRRAHLDGAQLAWAVFVRIPIGTALFEELAFRGLLLASLLQVTSTPRAVTWSSLAFGLWHIAPTIVALRLNDVAVGSLAGLGAIAGAVAVTTLAGAAFALLRLATGNLLAPVLAHWATNAVALVAAAFVDAGPGSARARTGPSIG